MCHSHLNLIFNQQLGCIKNKICSVLKHDLKLSCLLHITFGTEISVYCKTPYFRGSKISRFGHIKQFTSFPNSRICFPKSIKLLFLPFFSLNPSFLCLKLKIFQIYCGHCTLTGSIFFGYTVFLLKIEKTHAFS